MLAGQLYLFAQYKTLVRIDQICQAYFSSFFVSL